MHDANFRIVEVNTHRSVIRIQPLPLLRGKKCEVEQLLLYGDERQWLKAVEAEFREPNVRATKVYQRGHVRPLVSRCFQE